MKEVPVPQGVGRGFTFAGANRLEASGQGPWNA